MAELKIAITSPQNVPVEYEVASLGKRFLSFLVDYTIIIGYFAVISNILSGTPFANRIDSDPEWLAFLIYLIIYLPSLFYTLIAEIFFNGQTIGKALLKTRVVKLDGAPAGLTGYMLRWLLGLVEVYSIPLIALFAYSFNSRGQRLGDLAAGTTVINTAFTAKFEDTIFRDLDEHYTPLYPQVTKLTDRDVSIMNEVIHNHRRSPNPEVLLKLTQRLERVLGIEREQSAEEFITQLLYDYNYMTGAEVSLP